jgi:hypothetical protein
MPVDPYGYPTDERVQEAAPDHVALPLTASWVFLFGAFGLLCAGCGAWLGAEANEPNPIDKLGVGLLGAVCAFPAFGVVIWSVVLQLFARRWWAQAGPNIALGAGCGLLVWFVLFCSVAFVAGNQ